MSLRLTNLPIEGLILIERQPKGDSRGFLTRIFCAEALSEAGWNKPIIQINHTYTSLSGTVRGMHYQKKPYSEMKLVTCIRGLVWDVAIDLRKNSPTFLQWNAEYLSAENSKALLIPEGFAHGYQALSNDVELLYCHSASHNLESEAGLNARDPSLGINWPLEITEISKRDSMNTLIDSEFSGVNL
jgi:dTDP-4-dehydrorhamnose 3,5-epimerase